MNVSVSVVNDKAIVLNKSLADARGGKSARVKAVKGGKYLLAENNAGVGPENITVKRVGKNLHVALEGSDPDQPELIIENFVDSDSQLVGLGEDGLYHEYIAADGDTDSAAAFLMEGMSSPLALGSPQLIGFGGETIEIRMDGDLLGTALVGDNSRWSFTPTTAVNDGVRVFTAVAVSAGGAESDVSSSYQIRVDTVSPDAPSIESVHDNAGVWIGDIVSGQTTDDRTPTFSGKAEANSTIVAFNNGEEIGFAAVDGNGNWTYTPAPLAYGAHSFTFISFDVAGNLSDASEAWTVVVAAAVRSTGDIAGKNAMPSLQELLVDGDMDMFDVIAGRASAAEAFVTASVHLSNGTTLHDSWAINTVDTQGGANWLACNTIVDVNLLEQQLLG